MAEAREQVQDRHGKGLGFRLAWWGGESPGRVHPWCLFLTGTLLSLRAEFLALPPKLPLFMLVFSLGSQLSLDSSPRDYKPLEETDHRSVHRDITHLERQSAEVCLLKAHTVKWGNTQNALPRIASLFFAHSNPWTFCDGHRFSHDV